MANNEQQKGEMASHGLPEEVVDQTKLVDDSRRHFTKAGLAASGVLLTLASRSALGGTLVCKSPSGFQSGNVSQHGTPTECIGRTPGYWQTNTDSLTEPHTWPSPYTTGKCLDPSKPLNYQSWSNSGVDSGTMFRNVFSCTGHGIGLAPHSMMQVLLQNGSGDPYQLGAHIVAALLNAKMGWTPVLTEMQVVNIFNEYDSKGYFEPTAGVKWYQADIVNYLGSTQTL